MKPSLWRDAIRDSGLDRTAKLVAHTLSSYMNGAGDTFVGKETVRTGASLSSVRTVDEAVNRLERAGYLNVRRSTGGRKNHYIATTPQPVAGFAAIDPAGRRRKPRSGLPVTPQGAAPESAYSAESGNATARAADADAPIAIEEMCLDCSAVFTTADVDATRCPDCVGKVAA